MSQQQAVHVLAGSLILLGIVLAYMVSAWWLLLPAFVGLNLAQSGFTGFCPAEKVFAKLGLRSVPCDPKR
jgi:Inner membrane protein YgaP-like, transmembrane domain